MIVKVVDSATELRLQEVEQELLEAKVKYRTVLCLMDGLYHSVFLWPYFID